MAGTVTVGLIGWQQLELKLVALSRGLGNDVLQTAALRGATPIVTAIDDAAPPSIPDSAITTKFVAADAEHVEVDVSVTGDAATLDSNAQAAIRRAIDAKAQAALAEIAAEVSDALDKLGAK
jgi:hypothetical protein